MVGYARSAVLGFQQFSSRVMLEFWTKDRKLKRMVKTRYSLEGFVPALAKRVPDHYQHSIRYFGLLAPKAVFAP